MKGSDNTQRRIKNQVKHLRWYFLQKYLVTSSLFSCQKLTTLDKITREKQNVLMGSTPLAPVMKRLAALH